MLESFKGKQIALKDNDNVFLISYDAVIMQHQRVKDYQ